MDIHVHVHQPVPPVTEAAPVMNRLLALRKKKHAPAPNTNTHGKMIGLLKHALAKKDAVQYVKNSVNPTGGA